MENENKNTEKEIIIEAKKLIDIFADMCYNIYKYRKNGGSNGA